MKKSNIKVTTVLLLIFFQTSIFAQTINLGGTIVEIDEIPLNKPLNIKINTTLKSSNHSLNTQINVFKSSNNKFFVKVTNVEKPVNSLKSTNSSNLSHKLELYNAQGSLTWSKNIELPVLKCLISDNGSFCHAILYEYDMNYSFEKLVTFDLNGTIIFSEDNVNTILLNNNKNIIYYHTTQENSSLLVYKDLETNAHWTKEVERESIISDVSYDGNCILQVSNNGLRSFDSKGKLKWTNPNLGGQLMSLSNDGKHLLTLNRSRDLVLYDNHNGKYLLTITTDSVAGVRPKPLLGSIVDNSDSLILTVSSYLDRNSDFLKICLFNLSGKLLSQQDVSNKNVFISLIGHLNEDNTVSVFFEGKEVSKIELK